MTTYQIPEWLKKWVVTVCDALEIYEIDVDVEMVSHLTSGDGDICDGRCLNTTEINYAKLQFPIDIEDNDEGRITVIHEILHIKHARIDGFFNRVVVPETGSYTETSMKRTYKEFYEPYIHSMAKALYPLILFTS